MQLAAVSGVSAGPRNHTMHALANRESLFAKLEATAGESHTPLLEILHSTPAIPALENTYVDSIEHR